MNNQPRVPATELEDAGLPEGPAVYCWWSGETPIYVGAADNLKHQLLQVDMRAGLSPVPPCRQAVREHLKLLGRWPRGAGRAARRRAIDEFLAACSVYWREADSFEQAQVWAEQARRELWEDVVLLDRPGEDQWLRCYLEALEDPGLVYLEVPIGGGPGGKYRRIDAVRFCEQGAAVHEYDATGFGRACKGGGAIEIIEVKRTLNRTVIGQLLVARDLGSIEWELSTSRHVDLVALVTVGDTALEPFCLRHGIRVETVDRDCGDPQGSGDQDGD